MAKITKRILLSSLSLTDLSLSAGPEGSPAPDVPGNPVPSLPSLEAAFSMAPQGGAPGANVDFSFPAEDYRRVTAWFTGDFSHVTLPESATLKKNMTAAVKEAIDAYIAAANSKNLFLTPFRISCRLRLFDGSAADVSEPVLLSPSDETLRLIITDYNVYEKALHTSVAFSRSPAQLLFSIPAPPDAGEFLDIITAVEFYISSPAELYATPFSVSGVRSATEGGVRQRVWHYSANEVESMKALAEADTNFRLIASIPFSEVAAGKCSAPAPLPIEAGALSRFSSLPKLSAARVPGAGRFTGSQGWRPYLHVLTPPLDISLPEDAKAVSDLYLRGVFQRDKVTMTLYGSHHREGWRMLARAHGPYIRRLRRTPYRWHKVEIELPLRRDDFIEALTFRFHKA